MTTVIQTPNFYQQATARVDWERVPTSRTGFAVTIIVNYVILLVEALSVKFKKEN